MTCCRIAVACTLLSCIFLIAPATAQSGDRGLDMKARVLDILFPLDIGTTTYFSKMVLRFSDSDTQFVLVTYFGGKSELIRYGLAGIKSGELAQLISKMVAENPDLKEQDIASKLKVDVDRSPVDREALNRALNELKAIRISPVLANSVAVDEYPEYEFWYDTGQESVHYTITGPFGNASQDKLGKWMVKFRASVPALLKSGSGAKR
jgi:hypothetical protein